HPERAPPILLSTPRRCLWFGCARGPHLRTACLPKPRRCGCAWGTHFGRHCRPLYVVCSCGRSSHFAFISKRGRGWRSFRRWNSFAGLVPSQPVFLGWPVFMAALCTRLRTELRHDSMLGG